MVLEAYPVRWRWHWVTAGRAAKVHYTRW